MKDCHDSREYVEMSVETICSQLFSIFNHTATCCSLPPWTLVVMPYMYLVEVCLTCCKSYRLTFIFIAIYGVVSVQLAHFSSTWLKGYIYNSWYYHHQIGRIHLSNYHIFRGCVPGIFVTLYSVSYCIHVPGKPGICFHYYCAAHDEC